jgi:hypothetical protein
VQLKKASEDVFALDLSYLQRMLDSFNRRAKEMDVPLLKLALFLDPRYRQAAIKLSAGSSAAPSSSSSASGSSGAGSSNGSSLAVFLDSTTKGLAALKLEAAKLAQKLGYNESEVRELFKVMEDYAYNRPPFNKHDLSPDIYWEAVIGSPADAAGAAAAAVGSAAVAGRVRPELLANIAIKLREIKPTATSAEQVCNQCTTDTYYHIALFSLWLSDAPQCTCNLHLQGQQQCDMCA